MVARAQIVITFVPAVDRALCAIETCHKGRADKADKGAAAVFRGSQVMIQVTMIDVEPWWRGMMRTIMRSSFIDAAAALLLVAAAAPALAEPFPDRKPVEMTVMFGAGSAADVTARYLADGMATALGVPVPVVNRTGGG